MGREIDLLRNYPTVQRNLDDRLTSKSDETRKIARKFGREYFDGDRRFGYGGFHYDPKFWSPVIPDLVRHFQINPDSSILDVGCAKGFMLFDFLKYYPNLRVAGIDISEYALENSKTEVADFLTLANATSLPFEDKTFDFVFSINTIHNLDRESCGLALREISRVSRKGAFVVVDAYRNEEERRRLNAWNLTALTYMSTSEWRSFFQENGYDGDFHWFIP